MSKPEPADVQARIVFRQDKSGEIWRNDENSCALFNKGRDILHY